MSALLFFFSFVLILFSICFRFPLTAWFALIMLVGSIVYSLPTHKVIRLMIAALTAGLSAFAIYRHTIYGHNYYYYLFVAILGILMTAILLVSTLIDTDKTDSEETTEET